MLQILGYGSTYYLPAVLGPSISSETGWPLTWVILGFSVGMLAAGALSPKIGRVIDARGGRPVLAAGAVLMGLGLAGMGLASSWAGYVAAWLVIGAGMGAGLYEAAFSTLALLYDQRARFAITVVTLFGGFASTICWPLSAVLLESLGWRATCFAYAALHLALGLPLYLLVVPRTGSRPPADLAVSSAAAARTAGPDTRAAANGRTFALLAAILTASAAITSVVSVHLLFILQARDMTLAEAVALGALVGPSQVASRWTEMIVGRRFHPIWTLVSAVALMAAGLTAMAGGLPVVSMALIAYGFGLGIESIARGTVPLALFGARGYPRLMGRLAMPSLVAQALAPAAGTALLDSAGAGALLFALAGLAIANAGLVLVLRAHAAAAGRHGAA